MLLGSHSRGQESSPCEHTFEVTNRFIGQDCRPGCSVTSMKCTRASRREPDKVYGPLCPAKRERAEDRKEQDALRFSSVTGVLPPFMCVTVLMCLLIFEVMGSHLKWAHAHLWALFGSRLGITLDLEL